MGTSAAARETFFAPAAPEMEGVRRFIDNHVEYDDATRPRFYLSGAAPGDRVELPPEVCEALIKAVETMARGQAVTVIPRSLTLTTQQAAEMLGITRPTLVALLNAGKIPFEQPGKHRRLRLDDIISFREARKAQQYAALDRIPGDGEDEDPSEVSRRMESVRAEAARRRRGRT